MKKYKVGYTSGVYDLFHIGHLNIIENSKRYCDYLIVGVTSDELSLSRKNKLPIFTLEDRLKIVSSLKFVDEVVVQENMDKISMVKKVKANVVFVGSDWKGTPSWNEYEKQLKNIGVDVFYLPHTDGISTTEILEKIRNRK